VDNDLAAGLENGFEKDLGFRFLKKAFKSLKILNLGFFYFWVKFYTDHI